MQGLELDAFTDECAAVDATLADVPAAAWARTALGSWTLAELLAHLVRGVTRLAAYADEPVDPAAAVVDRVAYYRYDAAATAPGVARRAVDLAREVDAETLPALFAEGWREDAQVAAELPADRLVTSTQGPIRVDEFLATRVLEVVIHHADVRAALDLAPSPTPVAGRLAADLLEGLLGAPRPRNLGRVRFLLAATGRIPSDDPRLPVLT
jgi:uncharacterized protein (TIGR03083 family)